MLEEGVNFKLFTLSSNTTHLDMYEWSQFRIIVETILRDEEKK